MNFKKLSKEKRDQLILVVMLTAVALGGIGFGLIRNQYEGLAEIRKKESDSTFKLQNMRDTINSSDKLQTELAELGKSLAEVEADMATGDTYSWALDLVRRFRISYKVEVPGMSQPVSAETISLLPQLPYKQVSFTLNGNGYYHDIGKFIADFENQFPQMRIVNLTLNPISNTMSEDKEKLDFRMEIVALVRPNPS